MVYNSGPTEPNAKAVLNFGWEYLNAARLLFINKAGISPAGPVNYLASHSFELFTKAYLMSKGLKYKDLKNLGHEIQDLINECDKMGMTFSDDEITLAGVIRNLNVHHMQRYPMHGLFLIGPSGFAEPKNLIDHIERYGKRVESFLLKEAA